MLDYSIVIPVKNEEENLTDLFQEIEPVMQALQNPWELIFIDDGSTDKTPEILKDLAKSQKNVKVVTFARNFGQSSAFDAGFKNAQGQFVITMDADLQNDPTDIPKLVQAIDTCDLVCGWRQERNDPLSKKWISKLANFVRSRVCQDGMHDTGCSLKIYRREALLKIKLYQGMHRFLPALFIIEGFTVKEVPVKHRERVKGKSNYNFFNRSIGPLLDMFAVSWMRKRQLRYQIRKDGEDAR